MIAALALFLALQGDPQIEKVERLAGNVHRPLLWTPLRVTLSSAADFDGDVTVRSGFGFSVARGVKIKALGRAELLLPSLDPVEIQAGKTTFKMPRDFLRPERLVLVDARLPYAADLASTDQVLYQRITAADLEKLLPRGLLEAADLVLLKDAAGGGVVAATREEAEKAVTASTEHPPCLEAVDRGIWALAPAQGWVPSKKTWTLFFATTYVFAAFVGLAVIARRFPKFGLACVGGVAVLGIAGYGLFPRSHLWVVGQTVEVIPPAGAALEHKVWFIQSALELTPVRIEFPRLVKPVFPSMGGTDDPFTIRVDERGCSVEGLKLLPGRSACFGGVESRAATPMGEGLTAAVVLRGGQVEGAPPRSTEFETWKRFLGSDGRFGILGHGDRAGGQVKSPDLADERDRPPIFIQRFK